MSAHDTTHHAHNEEPRSKSSFIASFWFVVILVGLFIAALNFINVMGHDDEGHGGHATHENATGGAAHEGEGHATHEEHSEAATPAAGETTDSTAHEEAHH